MPWKTLYKQTSKGQIQEWTVSVDENKVTTVYGLSGGKLQTTVDIVKEGKNLGRSNATTPETQALLQAEQNYAAKLKEGYVVNKKVAASTKNTLEAVEPMLAHPIEAKEKYVVYPGLSQPKLDGLRCLAVMREGKVTLYSRTQKEFITVPHINHRIETILGYKGNLILDGELYNHVFRKDFNRITSLIKRDEKHKDSEQIQYHIYDVVQPGDYYTRTKLLDVFPMFHARYDEETIVPEGENCFRVETTLVNSREDLEQYQADCVERGFEGCMYRDPSRPYENKRSSSLLKVKTFQDDEFKVVDFEEGHGKLMNRIGAFYCELSDGRRFKAKPACTLEEAREYWKRRKDYLGKMATVKYQNKTPDGLPRFPVLKSFRDYE